MYPRLRQLIADDRKQFATLLGAQKTRYVRNGGDARIHRNVRRRLGEEQESPQEIFGQNRHQWRDRQRVRPHRRQRLETEFSIFILSSKLTPNRSIGAVGLEFAFYSVSV